MSIQVKNEVQEISSIPPERISQYIQTTKTVLYNLLFNNNLNNLKFMFDNDNHNIFFKDMIESGELIELLVGLIRNEKYDCFVFFYDIGIKYLLLEKSSSKLINDLLYDAIIDKSLDYITYLVDNGCKVPAYTCRFAVENSNYELLKFGFKNGAPLYGTNVLTPHEIDMTKDEDPVYYDSTFNICTIALQKYNKNMFEFGRDNGCVIESHVEKYVNNL